MDRLPDAAGRPGTPVAVRYSDVFICCRGQELSFRKIIVPLLDVGFRAFLAFDFGYSTDTE